MIRADLVDAIVAHARRDHPDEACGVVAGPEGSDRPERFVPMLNAARSPTFYEFDSGDLLRLYREMDDRDEEPVVIYHSHTATEAYPSRTDISYASEPDAHYVLVSTRGRASSGPSVSSGRTGSSTASSPRKKSASSRVVWRVHVRQRRGDVPKRLIRSRPSRSRPIWSSTVAVESIPTILRTYTGGEKAVEAERRHPRRA